MADYPFLPYDKSEYLDMMQGIPETSGYLTSPMFQEGFEDWNPNAWRNQLAEGMRQEIGARGTNLLGGVATETPAPGEYPYPDYDPKRWGTEFGHEITHSSIPSFQGWKDVFSKTAVYGGDLEAGKEEALNRMHDYMYGDYRNFDVSGPGEYLHRNKYLSGDYLYNPGQYSHQMDFTPKAYDTIRNSNLKDWQKGVMSLGPTTSRGQIGLGQRPDQVRAQGEAYMSPDRGRHTRPTMTQREMGNEAERTGGSVNPFEETRAQYKKGGIASLWHK